MSDVYMRYFRCTGGPLLEEAKRLQTARVGVLDRAAVFAREVGAAAVMHYRSGEVAGVTFDVAPDMRVWRQPDEFGHYRPRKNTREGKAMATRFDALERLPALDDLLPAIGLPGGRWAMAHGGYVYGSVIYGSVTFGMLFVRVPWVDEDPAELRKYREQRDRKMSFDMTMDHLLWVPPEELEEIKAWEADRDMESLSALVKSARQKLSGGETMGGEG